MILSNADDTESLIALFHSTDDAICISDIVQCGRNTLTAGRDIGVLSIINSTSLFLPVNDICRCEQ